MGGNHEEVHVRTGTADATGNVIGVYYVDYLKNSRASIKGN
jgi:hypothetical protein